MILITRRLNKQEIIIIFITLICHNKTYGDYCAGDHLFPSRTEKLSPVALMVHKLKKIFERITELITEYKPDEISIEAPFFGKNVQSMLKLGRAQGVAMAAALNKNIPVFEYSPRKIKKSITGKGNSSKDQVAGMIQNLLKMRKKPENLDATDGLAAALCHHFQRDNTNNKTNYSNWSAFVKQNKNKIKH